MFAYELDRLAQALRRQRYAGVVLLEQQRYRRARRDIGGHLRIGRDLADAAYHDELVEKLVLLRPELRRHAAGIEHDGRGAPRAVNEYLAGREPLLLESVGVHAAVLHREHAHGDAVHELVFAVLDRVERPLHGDDPLHHRRAEKAAEVAETCLPRERISAPAALAVDVGKRPVVHQPVPRRDEQPPVRALSRRELVLLDDDDSVAYFAADHAGHSRAVTRSARHIRVFEGEDIDLLPFRVHAPHALDLGSVRHAGVYDGRLRVEIGDGEVFGEYLEGRHHRDPDIAFAHLAVRCEHHALPLVPHDLVKSRARHLAPRVRLADELGKPVLGGHRRDELRRSLRRRRVVVLRRRGTHADLRLHARKLGEPRLHDGRDVVVHLAALPEVLPASVLDVPARGYLGELVADDEVHVQPPIEFERPPRLAPGVEVRAELAHRLLFPFGNLFVHLSLLCEPPAPAERASSPSSLSRSAASSSSDISSAFFSGSSSR